MKRRLLCFAVAISLVVSCMACAKENGTSEKSNTTDADYTSGVLLKEKLDVPDTVEDEYTSESGQTRVYVDAKVVMPEVSRVDVIEALPRVFADEEIHEFMQFHSEGIAWKYADSGCEYYEEPYTDGLPYLKYTVDGNAHYGLWLCADEDATPDGLYKSVNWTYGMNEKTGKPAFMVEFEYRGNYERSAAVGGECIPMTDGKAVDCTITIEEAIQMANEEVHSLLPDYELTWYGQTPITALGNPDKGFRETGQYYNLKYSRHLNGIPVNVSSINIDCTNDYGYTAGIGIVSVVVDDTGVVGLSYKNPYDVGSIIEEDVQLLPWDDVMDIFSKVSVLSIQSLEAYEEIYQNDLEVYEIRLGYMTVLQGDDTYRYTPVWDFYAHRILKGEGARAGSSDLPPIEEASWLTINAIDGTIIDRNLGY